MLRRVWHQGQGTLNGSEPMGRASRFEPQMIGWVHLTGRLSLFAAWSDRPHAFELRQGLAIAGAFGENVVPEPLRLHEIPALGGQGRQVAPGEMAVDPLVDAAELVGPAQAQDTAPRSLGLGRLAAVPVHDGLAEPELGVVGIDLKAAGTGYAARPGCRPASGGPVRSGRRACARSNRSAPSRPGCAREIRWPRPTRAARRRSRPG